MSSLNRPYYCVVAIITYVTYWSILVLLHLLPIDLHLTAHHVYLNGARAANSAIQWAIPILSLIFNLVKLASLQEADVIQVTQFMQQSVPKHKLIYVGHSSQKLSSRFNRHCPDINVKPKSCELAQHFHGNEECNINGDLKVYILQDNVTADRDRRECFEDRWIMRLDTKALHRMNTNLKHFAKIHYELFD